jgi:hypothetical protein
MDSRRSQRIINAATLQAAGVEENRVILSGGQLFRRSPSGESICVGKLSTVRLHRRHGSRYYHKTAGGDYIFDTGAHDGLQREAEAEDPEPERKAIKIYYYLGQLFLRTKNGVLTGDDQILHKIRG